METFKEKDSVYTEYGYGTIVKLPPSTTSSEQNPTEVQPPVPNGEGEAKRESPVKEEPKTEVKQVEEVKENKEENSEANIVQVRLSWGGNVYLDKKYLSKKIRLYIKTFYGARKKIALDVDINTTIQQLKNILLDKHLDHAKTLYNLRLIYSMGSLQDLNINSNTIEQYKVPNNANLILIVQMSFTWDQNAKASGIKLSNNNLTAGKLPEVDYQTVLGTLVMSSGRHYWEIKIDNFNDEEDIFIGVARKEANLYARPIDTNTFWGYMCCCGKKFGPDGIFQDYGYQGKKGDVIGVLLEYKSGLATLSFYRNATKCGVAFSNLTGSFYPAVCMNYGDVQVTLDTKAPMPIS